MNRVLAIVSKLPLAGIAIPPLAAITYWYSNMNRVLPWRDAFPTIAAVLGIGFALTALLRVVVGGWVRASLIGAIAAVYALYLPAAVAILDPPAWIRIGMLAILAVVAVDLACRLPREVRGLAEINGAVNVILIPAMLAMCSLVAAKDISRESGRPSTEDVFPAFRGSARAGSPDVWHIILDRYASQETLQRVYRFDNRPFLRALAARGFAMKEHAFSNYQRTAHSVSSTLNGVYLDALGRRMRARQADWVPIYRALTDNAAIRFFKSQGYATTFAGSWWNPTRESRAADRNLNFRDMPELARLVLDSSVFGAVFGGSSLPYFDARHDQCLRERFKFAALRRIAAGGERKYVFAHFLLPHPPYVISADGTCRSLNQATSATRRDNYIGQIEYANREVLKLIDNIEAGPRPAIIILHGDEGPWPLPYVGDERFPGADPVSVDWPKLNDGQLHEKMGILLAMRAPKGLAAVPVPDSPVNIYPTILHNYFAGRMEHKPDRHYLFVADDKLYTFDDVTPRLSVRDPARVSAAGVCLWRVPRSCHAGSAPPDR